jgi:multiple sugar transport system substrate-binding protein
MKYLIVTVFFLLLVASEETWRHMPDVHSSVPVITWVTDNNPARSEQIKLFQDWIAKIGGPPCKLVLDVGNGDDTKKIIQSVSGVGSDVMDVSNGRLGYYHAIGFLADVTDAARELHYDMSHTYPAIAPDICVRNAQGEERQYLFPCNVFSTMGIVNCGALRQFHQPTPPVRWTVQEFEALGKAFVDAANAPGVHDHFYSVDPDLRLLRRSMGVADFDETQTHSTLDDPKNVEALQLIQRWRAMHIIPSKADEASFTTANPDAYGGANGDLFNRGYYAIIWSGRHMVIGFRQDDQGRAARGEPPLELAVVEPPNGGFPYTSIGTRAAGVYEAGKHLRMAEYFQAFLASDAYNEQVLRDGDAMPPDPKWAKSEEYLHPAEDPSRGVYKETEWNFHGPFAKGALEIAVGGSYSPFVLNAVADREDDAARDLFLESEQLTAEEAVHRAQERINDEIQRTLNENPSLRPQYDALCRQQKQIDELKAAGKKVPLSLIIDPYRRAHMQAQGLTE